MKSADFGVFNMGGTVDLMESAFETIALDGSLLLDDNFMKNIFKSIVNKKDAFAGYLQYIFEKKDVFTVRSRKNEVSGCPLMSYVQNCFTHLQIT